MNIVGQPSTVTMASWDAWWPLAYPDPFQYLLKISPCGTPGGVLHFHVAFQSVESHKYFKYTQFFRYMRFCQSFRNAKKCEKVLRLSSRSLVVAFVEREKERKRMSPSWMCVVLTVCALFTLSVHSQTCDANASRTDCGFSGITQSECQAKGCCWSPLNPNPDNGERERKREERRGGLSEKTMEREEEKKNIFLLLFLSLFVFRYSFLFLSQSHGVSMATASPRPPPLPHLSHAMWMASVSTADTPVLMQDRKFERKSSISEVKEAEKFWAWKESSHGVHSNIFPFFLQGLTRSSARIVAAAGTQSTPTQTTW